MKNNILLSIIIPTYNVEDYITKCLESIVSQDIDPDIYEIIIINDGSLDGTQKIIQEFIDSHQNYNFNLINKENGGISSARNIGIHAALGVYIWFVDGDDYVENNILGKLLKEAKSDDLDLLAFDYDTIEEDNVQKSKSFIIDSNNSTTIYDGKTFLSKIYKGYFCMVCMFLIKRETFMQHKLLFKEKIYHEDVLITPQIIYYSKRIKHINTIGYHYIMRSHSITHNDTTLEKRLYDYINVCKIINEFIIFNVKEIKVRNWFYRYINEFLLTSLRLSIKHFDKSVFINLYSFAKKGKMIPLKYTGSAKRKSLIFFLNHSKFIFYKICVSFL